MRIPARKVKKVVSVKPRTDVVVDLTENVLLDLTQSSDDEVDF